MKSYDLRFKSGSTITISGPSQSGKSTLVETIVQDRGELFTEPISSVLWFCQYIPQNKIEGVKYYNGFPSNIMEILQPNSLVIVDDLMIELANSQVLTTLMTKAVHHLPMTLIYITQNIFHKSNDNKTRRLNTNYLILFKNPQDKSQIEYIGRQMYPKDKNFLSSAYEDATKSPYSYLVIDSQQSTPDEICVRTNITKDKIMEIYVPFNFSI